MSNLIKVVGIDPSLRNFGFAHAVIDIETFEINITHLELTQPPSIEKALKKVVRKNSDDLRRARCLTADLRKATAEAKLAIVEIPVGSQSARAMASYGICVGVLASCDIPIIEVTPSEVKLAAVGTKTASKVEMIEWAMALHPEANWKMRKSKGVMVPTNDNEHLADAIAAIYAGAVTEQFSMAASMMKAMAA